MLINYNAIDGFRISEGSIIASLMSDTNAGMLTDHIGSSPLNTLTENGTITYSAVASNSTTLWASGFSASNYFSLPYTSALDPGLNGYSHKVWFKTLSSISTNDVLFSRQSFTPAAGYYIYINSTGNVVTLVRDTSTHSVQSVNTYHDNRSHCAVTTFDGSVLKLFIDGYFIGSLNTGTLTTLTNVSAVLNVGVNWVGGDPADTSSIAGLEIEIGRQWTAQQIKAKYESEKALFQADELFSIRDRQLTYESDLIMPNSKGFNIADNLTESQEGLVAGYTDRRKRIFNCNVKPFLDASLPSALKFLKSCDQQQFVFDALGSTGASPNYSNPIQVYKTSHNEIVTFNNPYHKFGFSLVEA